MNKYYVEKFNASDDSFKISEFYINSGNLIKTGEIICSIESSKADIDIESQSTGYLYHNYLKGNIINVGDLFYIISQEKLLDFESYFIPQISNQQKDYTVSKKANELLIKNNITPNQINKKIIKEEDVLDFINRNQNIDLKVNLNINNIDKSILILGGQGGAKMCIDAIRSKNEYEIIGIIDPELKAGDFVLDVPILGGENLLNALIDKGLNKIVVSFSSLKNIGYRLKKIEMLKSIGFLFPNIVHSSANIEPSSSLGEGNIILASSIIGSCCVIGNFNYINTGAIICHDAFVADNNHFAPNSVIAGRVLVGSNSLIGINVSTFYDIRIGSNVIINNGVSVNNNVDDFTILKK
jgi:sugar O-acyltransferase (sialic acid O-acetyltransferase NeuD family)